MSLVLKQVVQKVNHEIITFEVKLLSFKLISVRACNMFNLEYEYLSTPTNKIQVINGCDPITTKRITYWRKHITVQKSHNLRRTFGANNRHGFYMDPPLTSSSQKVKL